MRSTSQQASKRVDRQLFKLPPFLAACAAVALMMLAGGPADIEAAKAQTETQPKSGADSAKKGGGGDGKSAQQGKKKRSGKRRRRGGPAQTQVDQVRMVPVTQTVPVLGRLVPSEAGVIAARIAGPIQNMKVDVGDRVKQGDVLAVLVPDTLRWKRELQAGEVAQYEGALASAKAKLAKVKNELRRLRNLRRSAAFSQARFEDQEHEVNNSQGEVTKVAAELRQAKAQLKLADINLYNAKVRAPFPGVVTKRHTDSGAYVNVGAAVVTMINDQELEIEADVPANRLGGLRPGVNLRVELDDKKPYEAMVRAVVPDENPLARTRAVRLMPDEDIRRTETAANQSILLHVPVGAPREALSVHKDAVLQRQGGTVVYVVEKGRAKLRRVRLGEAIGSRFEVRRGLKSGDKTVVRGNERLRPDQKVRVKRAEK